MSAFNLRVVCFAGLLGALAWATPAQAAVNKCVDAQGNVTFTDRPCGKDEKKQEVETQAASRPADDLPSVSDHMQQQMQEFNDKIEVKVRDLKARCTTGDKEACKDATCARLYTEGPSPLLYRECATASGYASTSVWAQGSEVSFDGSMSTSVSIVCLVNPEVMTIGGKSLTIYQQLRLENRNHATAYHERGRWSAGMFKGPDFATWEEAANSLCKAARPRS